MEFCPYGSVYTNGKSWKQILKPLKLENCGINGEVLKYNSNAECLKKRLTTLKAYIHLFGGHEQCIELS
jgi:hypothetical protein